MTTARDEILARVRAALADVPDDEQPSDVAVPRAYRDTEPDGTVERFVERVRDYGATVRTVAAEELPRAVAEATRSRGVAAAAVPPDLPSEWLSAGVDVVMDDGLTPGELDRVGAAITACALAIAETGTIVLDGGPGQGRRLLTLLPDVHVCVVHERQIVDGVPSALRRLAAGFRGTPRPVTFVSGPSATADIELSRVEGVHGPRKLDVLVVTG